MHVFLLAKAQKGCIIKMVGSTLNSGCLIFVYEFWIPKCLIFGDRESKVIMGWAHDLIRNQTRQKLYFPNCISKSKSKLHHYVSYNEIFKISSHLNIFGWFLVEHLLNMELVSFWSCKNCSNVIKKYSVSYFFHGPTAHGLLVWSLWLVKRWC